jgi:secondary thiamine-phosphate synthase enzyme
LSWFTGLKHFRRYALALGLKIGAHALRATAATNALDHDADIAKVQEWLVEAYFSHIAPEDAMAYSHDDEGPDDMPAHLRTALTRVQLSIPMMDGKLALGTWQGIYLFEHRRRPHTRTIALYHIGE